MIVDALLDWLFGIFEWVIDNMVPSDLPESVVNFSFITDINYFLPISEMFLLFVAMFALGGPMVATSLIIWVFVGVLRGGSTKA